MSEWKANPKKVYLAGKTMFFITESSDLHPLVNSGVFEFCKTNLDELLPGSKVKLADGTILHVDIIMYATGYQFTYPFMDKEDKVVEVEQQKSGGRFAYPLYK